MYGKLFHANDNKTDQRQFTFIKLEFDSNIGKKDKEGHYIMTKLSIHIL